MFSFHSLVSRFFLFHPSNCLILATKCKRISLPNEGAAVVFEPFVEAFVWFGLIVKGGDDVVDVVTEYGESSH